MTPKNPTPTAAELPRYAVLAICVRCALYGSRDPLVQQMIQRNESLTLAKAVEALA